MKKENLNEERLGKIIELAKNGIGGEKENAIVIVRKLCEKHDLDFDEVMSEGEKIQEFMIDCKKNEATILAQTIFRYGVANKKCSVWTLLSGKGVKFEGTQKTYIEALSAWAILSRLYQKEKKRVEEAMVSAFIDKHMLFYSLKEGEKETRDKIKLPTEHELEVARMAAGIERNLEDAHIYKTLKG